MAGECATTGAELDVGHGTVRVKVDIRYIAMWLSRLEAFWKLVSRIQVKEYLKNLPTVVMVTQRQHEKDIIEALDQGADDFISKPFSPSVLFARVFAAYRRRLFSSLREAKETELDFGSIVLDEKNEIAHVNGEQVALTRQELKLAYLLLSRAGSILSRSYLYEYVCGITHGGKTRTLDVHVHRVRKKLSLNGEHGWNLESVYGHGYRLERIGDNAGAASDILEIE